jgi:hypothetical protein
VHHLSEYITEYLPLVYLLLLHKCLSVKCLMLEKQFFLIFLFYLTSQVCLLTCFLEFLYIQHKCDLINMSYGEPTILPDYGRFIDLVNEASSCFLLLFLIHTFLDILVFPFRIFCWNLSGALFYFTGCGQASYYIY